MRKPQALLAGTVLIVLGTLSVFYWAGRKQVWFCDEIYSYESANGFEQDWPAENVDVWQTGADVESYFAADWQTLSFNDITIRLYNDHVPLYFWIFRIVSVLVFPGNGTIWIGMGINLFFYLILLGIIYRMFLSLTKNPWAAGVVSVLTCVVNRLMIEQVTILRMYMMLLLAMVLLLLAEFGMLSACDNGAKPLREAVFLFLVSTFGFLTHYDFWIFYAVTVTLVCLWLLFSAFRKNGRKILRSREFGFVLVNVCSFVLSLGATIAIFPYCRWNLNQGKGKTALSSLLVFSKEKAEYILWGYRRLSAVLFGDRMPVWLGLLLIFGCILGGALILYRKGNFSRFRNYVLTVAAAQAYQLLVCFTMPAGTEERYLWGVFSIIMWCMAYGVILLSGEGVTLAEKRFAVCFAAEGKHFAPVEKRSAQEGKQVAPADKHRYAAAVRRGAAAILIVGVFLTEIAVIDGGSGVAYLFYPGKDRDQLEEYADIPWIVYNSVWDVYSYYDWIIPEQICFLSGEDTEADAEAVKEKAGAESFLLYVYEGELERAEEFLGQTLGKDVEAEYLMQSTNFYVYVIRVSG